MLIVDVSDTGIGIDAEVLPRIFEMFEQGGAEAARRSGGLGLGLTISRSIVEQHGGRLIAASEGRDCGATFTIEMPTVSAPAAVPTIEPVAADEPATRRPLRILLVDDNDDTRLSLTELLNRRGHDVRAAEGVEAALRAAADSEIDLLISDIELTDGNGLQLLQALRRQRPVLAIALSGIRLLRRHGAQPGRRVRPPPHEAHRPSRAGRGHRARGHAVAGREPRRRVSGPRR